MSSFLSDAGSHFVNYVKMGNRVVLTRMSLVARVNEALFQKKKNNLVLTFDCRLLMCVANDNEDSTQCGV